MNNLIHDAIESRPEEDEQFMIRLHQLMAEMIEDGFVEYVDSKTGKMEKLTFETVISEGCETEGFIASMFEFFQCSILKKKDLFLDQIEQLTISYLEKVVEAEQGIE